MKAFLAPLEQAGVNAWVQDLQSGAFSLSRELWRRLGQKARNRPRTLSAWQTVVHADDLVEYTARVEQLIAGVPEIDLRLRLADGHGNWRTFEISGRVVRRDEANQPLLIGGVLKELADTEFSPELFKAVIIAATEGVWMNGPDGITSFANQRMAEMLATTPRDMIGRSPLDFIFPADHDFAGGIIARTMSGASERFEINLRRATGDPIPVLGGSAPIRDGHGEIVGAVAMFSDLTAWRAAQDALRESERQARIDHARLSAAKQGAGAGAWEFDLRSKEVTLDEASLAMHGLDAGAPRTMPCQQWLAHVQSSSGNVEALISNTADEQFSFEFSTQAGTRWISCLGRAIADERGVPAKVVGLHLDITDRKCAEAEMTRMRAELAQFARRSAMGTMASTIAHELNQPLAAAANYLSAATMMIERGEAQASMGAVKAANHTLLRAGEIIRKIRQGVGDINSQRRDADLRETILSALGLALLDAPQKGIRVSKHLNRNISVFVDPIQIEQVIINLVRNAVHAVAEREAPKISISTSVANGRATIHISDNGSGVPAAIMDRLFDTFSTSKEGGMGIGLSVSRTIIEAHEGRLWLHKTSAFGTTFKIELPLTITPQKSKSAAKPI